MFLASPFLEVLFFCGKGGRGKRIRKKAEERGKREGGVVLEREEKVVKRGGREEKRKGKGRFFEEGRGIGKEREEKRERRAREEEIKKRGIGKRTKFPYKDSQMPVVIISAISITRERRVFWRSVISKKPFKFTMPVMKTSPTSPRSFFTPEPGRRDPFPTVI